MLYTIKLKYVDFSNGKSDQAEGNLVLNLPQTTLAEARRNLFVKDLVRMPEIYHYYKDDPNYQKAPESLLLQYAYTDMPEDTQKVRVVYKRAPEFKDDVRYEFVFYIDFDAKGRHFNPLGQIDFTCRREYDVYYEAFMNDQLILGNPILSMKPYQENDYVRVFTANDCDLAQVHYDAQGVEKAEILYDGNRTIDINETTYPCIRPIYFTPEVLNILSVIPSEVYINDISNPCYEITLAKGDYSKTILIRIVWDNKQYYVLDDTQNGKQQYQLFSFTTLNKLQNIIQDRYHVSFVVNNITGLGQYVKGHNRDYKFLMSVTDYISSFGVNADYDEVLKLTLLKFNIPIDTLNSFLTAYRGRHYFK